MSVSPVTTHSTNASIVTNNDNTRTQDKYVVDDNLDVSQGNVDVQEGCGTVTTNPVNNPSKDNL